MAAKTVKTLNDKETPVLKEELNNLRKKLFELRTQTVTEKVEDTSQFRKSKKDVARIMTALNQRNAATEAKAAQK